MLIGDSTETEVVTLWEGQIGSLKLGYCYDVKRLRVCSFSGKKYLSSVKGMTEFVEVDEAQIGEVKEKEQGGSSLEEESVTYEDVCVGGVKMLDSYKMCFGCKEKVEPDDDEFGTCRKCKMLQMPDNCETTKVGHLVLKDGRGEIYNVRGYGDVLDSIAVVEGKDARSLMRARVFSCSVVKGVLKSVWRK